MSQLTEPWTVLNDTLMRPGHSALRFSFVEHPPAKQTPFSRRRAYKPYAGWMQKCSCLISSFPRRNAQPAFLFVYLHLVKARLLQIRLQLGILVDGHAADELRPFLVLVRIAVAFVADEKCPAGLQHPVNLPEALRQIGPEIDGFKGCDRIKPVLCEDNTLHTALPHHTAPLLNCSLVETLRFLHTDGRVVDALYDTSGAFFQKSLDVRPSAAAAVQHLGIRRKL